MHWISPGIYALACVPVSVSLFSRLRGLSARRAATLGALVSLVPIALVAAVAPDALVFSMCLDELVPHDFLRHAVVAALLGAAMPLTGVLADRIGRAGRDHRATATDPIAKG